MNREEVISFSPPTPESCDPSPLNDVAVTTPTALIPPARTLIPVRAVISPTESTFLTSSYVRVPPTDTLPVNVAVVPLKLVAVATPVILTPVWNVGAPVPALLVNKSALILPPAPTNGVTPTVDKPRTSGINSSPSATMKSIPSATAIS